MEQLDMIVAFALAVQRENTMFLDNVGIRIDFASLPTWPRLRETRDRLFGRGLVGRFWCRKVRPRLMPNRQRQYRAEYEIADKAHRVEFMRAVLEKGKKEGYYD